MSYLDERTPPEQLAEIRRTIDQLAAESPYGWGNTLDLGAGISIDGVLEDKYLALVERWRSLGWLSEDLRGKRAADVGGWNGGITIELVKAGATVVVVEEIPPHARQFEFVREVLQLERTELIVDTLYRMPSFPETRDLDLIVMAGVLYHLSDMIVGLKSVYDCLRPGGTLLIQSAIAPERDVPYADFGDFAQGVWWAPSLTCIERMLRFVGFDHVEVEPHIDREGVARAVKVKERQMTFKRGLNYPFASLLDAAPRTMTPYFER